MKLYIKEVGIGTFDPQENYIGDFWIIGALESGRKIKIKDLQRFDLRKFTNEKVNCLILTSYIGEINSIEESDEKNIASPVIRGIYLGEYLIPEKWAQCKGYKLKQGYHAVNTKDGIFLISPRDFIREGVSIEKNEEIVFEVASLRLQAWLPVEND